LSLLGIRAEGAEFGRLALRAFEAKSPGWSTRHPESGM